MNRNVFARAALAFALALGASHALGQEASPPAGGASPPSSTQGAPSTGSPAKGSKGPKGAATTQPGPAAQDLAKTMVSARSWAAMIDGYSEALSNQISRALQARGEKPPDDLEQKVRTQLAGALDHQEGLQLEATELAARFSEPELKAISSFYKSPAGQKLMKELPEMSASVDARIRERLGAAVPKIVQNVAPSLAESTPGGGAHHPGAAPGGGTAPETAPPAQGRTPPPPSPPKK